jgi:hypothetical protein
MKSADTLFKDAPVAINLYRQAGSPKYRESQKIFTLQGSLRESRVLDPIQFRASLRR